jgi:hypothetical protein
MFLRVRAERQKMSVLKGLTFYSFLSLVPLTRITKSIIDIYTYTRVLFSTKEQKGIRPYFYFCL